MMRVLVKQGHESRVSCDIEFLSPIGEQGEVPIHISDDMIRRDITLRGSWFYHFCEVPRIVELYRSGLQAERLITNTFPLAQAQTAFDRFFDGSEGKVLLHPQRSE